MSERRAAIITGGGKGIGRAIALQLAVDGANVIINYAGSRESAEKTAEACRVLGAEAYAFRANVAQQEDCTQLADYCMEKLGRIDILVNNAGITRDNLMMRMDLQDFQSVIDTNLKGCFLMMKAVSRPMMRAHYGRIISISSISALTGNPGQINYTASKAGIIGMTRTLARELASRNITVNAVAPGAVDTDMTRALPEKVREQMIASIPMKRMGAPEDIANAVSFLAKEESAYITGQVLNVSGGMYI